MIHQHLRRVDSFGRWGGEEFLVICPYTDEAGALNLAKSYQKQIEKFEFSEVGRLNCSFGVAEYPMDTDRNTVLSHADKALYRAKDAGRNRVEYYSKFEYDLR